MDFSIVFGRYHCGEELQIYLYAQHASPLNNDSSLACENYCDNGSKYLFQGHLIVSLHL